MALAHAVGDKAEAAYRRGDLFEKRRQLAEAWATFCGGGADRQHHQAADASGLTRTRTPARARRGPDGTGDLRMVRPFTNRRFAKGHSLRRPRGLGILGRF
jgi:hypothetical protein